MANLVLARASGRQKELAIRTALGADRLRLIRQLVTESVLMSLLGGALGLLLAFWGIQSLLSFSPASLPRLEEIHIENRVLVFTLILSLLTGILLGLTPGLRASQIDLNQSYKEGAGTSTGGRSAGRCWIRSIIRP